MANVLGPMFSAIGTDVAGKEQRKGMNNAMDQLKQSYGQAAGFQQPIYDMGLKNYQGLSDQNAAGGFSMPKATPFDPGKFNFQADPGYQFTKQQGEDQIVNRASMGGMAHSPQTTKALMGFDTGLANQTFNDAFNRFNTDRVFGQNASNTAFNQNFMNNGAAFGRGVSLMNPGLGAANNLSGQAIGQGGQLADLMLGKGNLSGQLAANPWMMANGTAGALDQQGLEGQQLFSSLFGGNVMQGMGGGGGGGAGAGIMGGMMGGGGGSGAGAGALMALA